METIPKRASLVSGDGEGETRLEAIDNALLNAGIGNLNLVKVSSVLPVECKISKLPKIKPGAVVPVVIGEVFSSIKSEKISAAVVVGESKNSHGLISEYAKKGISKDEAERRAKSILEKMMENRDSKINNTRIASAEHTVEKMGASIAAVVLTS